MKKQILILILFVAAIVAGTTNAFAQPTQVEVPYLDLPPTYCTPAVPLTCATTGNGLNPVAGVSYNYSITVSGAPSSVHFFVTDDNNVISGQTKTVAIDPGDGTGSYILVSETGVYNNTGNTTIDLDITWKSFDGNTNEVLLVAYAIDAAGCTDNVEVWRIIPDYSFTLDIAGLEDGGDVGGDAVSECVSPVQEAIYNAPNLTMDYGENWIFFSVNAANWQDEWTPTFSTIYAGGSTLGTVEWAYPDQASGAGSVWHPAADPVEASHYEGVEATNDFVGLNGACIVLRLQVDHGGNEIATAAETVTVGVDGEMINPQGKAYDGTYPDLDEGNPDCVDNVTDEATYTLDPRPVITDVAPNPFETKN